MNSFAAFLTLAALLTITHAHDGEAPETGAKSVTFVESGNADMPIMESPEPDTLPTDPGLYLTTAGLNSRVIRPLTEKMVICPSDYPAGISIMCVADAKTASFIVNGNHVRREFRMPFYLNGDLDGRVRPWKNIPESARIRCLPKKRHVMRVHVFFKC